MKYTLFIHSEVLKTIQKEIKACPLKETGGILIGYKADCEIVVTNATGPGPNAKHSFFNFSRDIDYCNSSLEQYFYESNGILTYIGEWHTHPYGRPIPSRQDDKELFSIGRTDTYQNNAPLLVIGRKTKKDLLIGPFLYTNSMRIKIPFSIY
jgi:integrative and conjugative element protein (TIGR02256 family)